MKALFEGIKANKGKIIKRTLIIGGVLLGGKLILDAVTKKDDDFEDEIVDANFEEIEAVDTAEATE
jgi:hypothetical protein